jgi:two-component system, OmpR family, sensor histidine kinase AdeS
VAVGLQSAATELRESTAATAHELRTPLTILQRRLHGIADGVFELNVNEIAPLLKQVVGSTRIVEDFRKVTLADTGRLELHRQSTNIADESATIVSAFQSTITASGMVLKFDMTNAQIHGDVDRLPQAVLAALENARVHAAGGKIVSVETGATATHAFV